MTDTPTTMVSLRLPQDTLAAIDKLVQDERSRSPFGTYTRTSIIQGILTTFVETARRTG
jgi:hypothetical protein